MSELDDLYQELIIDHNKTPRNFRVVEGANRQAEGYNPLCGDQFTVYLQVEGDVIKDVGFQGSGCAISKASASMMTAALKGKAVTEARELYGYFHIMLAGAQYEKFDDKKLGKLSAFAGVREYPVRVKCATLPWHTLRAGLDGESRMVSTETVSTEWEAG
jgi:nitrogen fixation NifU-like protein